MLKQNLVPRFCGERNVFRINARIPRIASKKLHKVFHQSIFAPSVLDILWKSDKHCSQCWGKILFQDFVRERNLLTATAPIRRVTCKKLHKVFHQFFCGLRPCKIVRTVKILLTKCLSKILCQDFVGERNLFTNNAPIRRVTCKKLHKVSHQFFCGLRPCKIVRTVKILLTKFLLPLK